MNERKKFEGRDYEIAFGNDGERDGVHLELSDCTDDGLDVLAELFFCGATDSVLFSAYARDIPYPLIRRLLDEAAHRDWPSYFRYPSRQLHDDQQNFSA